MKRFLEGHVIKSYGYSNLNRDAGGSPKTTSFGDGLRARISSQCIKRNFRFTFYENIEHDSAAFNLLNNLGIYALGSRTRKINRKIKEYFELNFDEGYSKYYDEILNSDCFAYLGKSEKNGKSNVDEGTKTIQFYSMDDIRLISEICKKTLDKEGSLSKLNLEKHLKDSKEKRLVTIDMALFGRMAPTSSFYTVDGTMQVAHAFSTNKIKLEDDFLVAIDDVINDGEDENGSGHLTDFEYTSACFYEYFNFDIESFLEYFKGVFKDEEEEYTFVKVIVSNIIKSMVEVHPTGKQNSTARYPLPYMVMITLSDRKKGATYENAFLTSITNNSVEAPVKAFVDYVSKSDNMSFVNNKKFITCNLDKEDIPNNIIVCDNVMTLLDDVLNEL